MIEFDTLSQCTPWVTTRYESPRPSATPAPTTHSPVSYPSAPKMFWMPFPNITSSSPDQPSMLIR